jgi:hypothetical protein
MSIRQLKYKVYNKWHNSNNIKQQYHTFEFYWWEKYARVYRLPSKIEGISDFYH